MHSMNHVLESKSEKVSLVRRHSGCSHVVYLYLGKHMTRRSENADNQSNRKGYFTNKTGYDQVAVLSE